MGKSMCLAFIPSIFSTVALVLSFISNLWCETIQFEPNFGSGDNAVLPTRSFGPFYRKDLVLIAVGGSDTYAIANACVAYQDGVNSDSLWKTTQAFAIITVVIGAVMVFWTWLSPCLNFGAKYWKLAGFAYMFCCLTQGLTLLFLQSSACEDNSILGNQFLGLYSDTCSWGWGTSTNIAAVVLWFVAGALMCVVPPPEPKQSHPPATQTVTYSENQNADDGVTESNVEKGTYVAGEGVTEDKEVAEDKEVTEGQEIAEENVLQEQSLHSVEA